MTTLPYVTVLRLKRKIDEEALDAFIVDKKQKGTIESSTNRVFKRVQTLSSTEVITSHETVESIVTKQAALKSIVPVVVAASSLKPKEKNVKEDVYQKVEKRRDEVLQENLAQARRSRYAIMMKNRNLTSTAVSYQVLDIAKEGSDDQEEPVETEEMDPIMCNLIPMVREYLNVNEGPVSNKATRTHYVYDLFVEDTSANAGTVTNAVNAGILELSDDEFWWHTDDEDEKLYEDEDEDSNAEDYWMNDYPDEEDYYSEC